MADISKITVGGVTYDVKDETAREKAANSVKTVNGVAPDANGNVTVSGGSGGGITTETDPTVPAWAKAATKPTYTAAEVGALPASTVIPTALPTPNKLTFTGAVNAEFDGSEAVTVEIPSGGGGSSGGGTWEQFFSMTTAEDVAEILINTDNNGNSFSYDEIQLFAQFVGTTANETESTVEFSTFVGGSRQNLCYVEIPYAKRKSGSVQSYVSAKVSDSPSGLPGLVVNCVSGASAAQRAGTSTKQGKITGLRFYAKYIGAGTMITAYGMNRS